MSPSQKDQSRINLYFAAVAVVMVAWGVAEFAGHTLRPDTISREDRINNRFRQTTDALWNNHALLQSATINMASLAQTNLHNRSLPADFYQHIKDDETIWAIYRDSSLVMWSEDMSEKLHQTFIGGNQVIFSDKIGLYLVSTSGFTENGSTWTILGARKMYTIANPGSRFGDVYIPIDKNLQKIRPAPYYLEGSPDQLPTDNRFHIITLYDEATTGHLTINTYDPQIRSYIHPNLDLSVRLFFFVTIFVLLWRITSIYFSEKEAWVKTWARQLLLTGGGWTAWNLNIVVFLSRVLVGLSESQEFLENTGLLLYFYTSLVVAGSVVLLSIKFIKDQRYFGFTWYPRTITFSVFYGLFSGFSFFMLAYVIGDISTYPFFDFINPSLLTTLLGFLSILSIGLTGISVLMFTFLSGWFLMNSERDQIGWVHPLTYLGFFYSYVLLSYLYGSDVNIGLYEHVWIGTFYLVIYFASMFAHKNPAIVEVKSIIKASLLCSLLLILLSAPIIQSNALQTFENKMLLSAKSTLDADSWRVENRNRIPSSHIIAHFENDSLISISGDFSSGQFPDVNSLANNRYRSIDSGKHIFNHYSGSQSEFVELIYRYSQPGYIMVLAWSPNWGNHVFSFFKLLTYWAMIFAVFFLVLNYFTSGRMLFYTPRTRFQNRITDSYILSSFICLIVLIAITQQILKNQTVRNIELEITDNLKLLEMGISNGLTELNEGSAEMGLTVIYYSLDDLPVTFNSELAYTFGLSNLVPYEVYNQLRFGPTRRVIKWGEANGEPRITGFRSYKIDEAIAGAITLTALPFSRKYSDQSYQIASVLIMLYLLIFGIFILGGFIISREIIKPVKKLQRGLDSIATGDFETIIPVESQDEIGQLANSFNLMLFKFIDLQKNLAETEREAAWTDMARQIAHEIKNPLTPMKLSIQHLKQQAAHSDVTVDALKEKIKKISSVLIDEIDSLNNIASDFSKFAKPVQEQFVVSDLNEVVQSVMELYQHDNRVEIQFDQTSEDVKVEIAVDEFKRVLINLIKNAMEAIKHSGVILVRTHRFADNAYIEIVDNGSGIKKDIHKNIFLPNFSTKKSGTGLGLAICKKIVAIHKGRIHFATVLNLGTTFTISLPLYSEITETSESE